MKIVSGILKPTKGTVETCGSIAPLIELGAGFDANLSARENIYLNGAILGYSRAYMSERFDEIIEFAELQDFVDTAVKNYSSGMVARLGFAIATMNVPDILIIDEILAVGDYKFQEKSFARMQEMIASGATVVFVSHSIEQVQKICKRLSGSSTAICACSATRTPCAGSICAHEYRRTEEKARPFYHQSVLQGRRGNGARESSAHDGQRAL